MAEGAAGWWEDRSFGNNQFGQLGLHHTENMNHPTAVPTFSEMEVVDAACGAEHTVAVTSTGRVYSWGWGCYGNLGVGDLGHQHVPQLVPLTAIPESDGKVVSVACGWRHSGLVTANGALYTFGEYQHSPPSHSRRELDGHTSTLVRPFADTIAAVIPMHPKGFSVTAARLLQPRLGGSPPGGGPPAPSVIPIGQHQRCRTPRDRN